MTEMTERALEKLEAERAAFKGGNRYAQLIYEHVADTLKELCRMDAEFAQAVVQTEKTLSDCCQEITKDFNIGGGTSDLEVYRRAVRYYFPGADIRFTMELDLCASVRPADAPKPSKGLMMDLTQFL